MRPLPTWTASVRHRGRCKSSHPNRRMIPHFLFLSPMANRVSPFSELKSARHVLIFLVFPTSIGVGRLGSRISAPHVEFIAEHLDASIKNYCDVVCIPPTRICSSTPQPRISWCLCHHSICCEGGLVVAPLRYTLFIMGARSLYRFVSTRNASSQSSLAIPVTVPNWASKQHPESSEKGK